MKGSIFENFIITEFLKENFNRGEIFELYFWRDNHQKEIDLIVNLGAKQYGLEIKSTKTIQEKHFSSLNYWLKLTKGKEEEIFLIYSGQENYLRNKINVVSWNNIAKKIIDI